VIASIFLMGEPVSFLDNEYLLRKKNVTISRTLYTKTSGGYTSNYGGAYTEEGISEENSQ